MRVEFIEDYLTYDSDAQKDSEYSVRLNGDPIELSDLFRWYQMPVEWQGYPTSFNPVRHLDIISLRQLYENAEKLETDAALLFKKMLQYIKQKGTKIRRVSGVKIGD